MNQISNQNKSTYYVDSVNGDNNNSGMAPEEAWQTLAPVNDKTFVPGDQVLLRAGCEFSGPLTPQGSGQEGMPIIIDRYGDGANPAVHGEGKIRNTIELHNQPYWEIRNLCITNNDGEDFHSEKGRAIRRAVYITAEDAGDVAHIHLNNLEIRNVRGMYRYEGHDLNGGIICRVLGGGHPTRFVDLRIEGCEFHTASIEHHPAVVSSAWGKDPQCEVVWNNNTFDHSGRAYIVIPAGEWPRKYVYYFCPDCSKVFGLEKTAAPVCAECGRFGCEDIFSEIAARLRHTWTFFEETREEKGKWLFRDTPGGEVAPADAVNTTKPTASLSYYGAVRALGFTPPWLDPEDEQMQDKENAILREWLDELTKIGVQPEQSRRGCRVLMNEREWPKPNTNANFWDAIQRYGEPADLSTCESAQRYFNSLPWRTNPYAACNFIGKALYQHWLTKLDNGEEPEDEVYYYVKELIDDQFQPDIGCWGGQEADHITCTNGNMKMLTTYVAFDWEIPAPKKIIDFHLSGVDENLGFAGRGCPAFNQMSPLKAIRRKYPELASYRSEEIDYYTAMTFMNWLSNWDETRNFYGDAWGDKHNNGLVMHMAPLLLDLLYL